MAERMDEEILKLIRRDGPLPILTWIYYESKL